MSSLRNGIAGIIAPLSGGLAAGSSPACSRLAVHQTGEWKPDQPNRQEIDHAESDGG
jgi:hypothetical protein